MSTTDTAASRRRLGWAVVGLLALLVWWVTQFALIEAGSQILPDYVAPPDRPAGYLGVSLLSASALTAAAAVVLARRWVWRATLLAAYPLAVLLLTPAWLWGWWLSLVLVAVVGVWRSWRRALVPAGLALLLAAHFVYAQTTTYLPGYTVRMLDYRGDPWYFPITVALYAAGIAVPVAVSAAIAAATRSSRAAATAQRETRRASEVTAVTTERARIARDLHDVVAHHVSLIAVRAETAPYTTSEIGAGGRAVLTDIAADARRAMDELRAVLGVLKRADGTDAERAPQPSLGDIPGLVERTRAAGERVSLHDHTAHRAAADVPVGVGYAAYRVVQEALTNARRHAPGAPVDVHLQDTPPDAGPDGPAGRPAELPAGPPCLVVRVINPTSTQAATAQHGGSGLAGMRERVEALGGRLTAGVTAGEFVVEARLPTAVTP